MSNTVSLLNTELRDESEKALMSISLALILGDSWVPGAHIVRTCVQRLHVFGREFEIIKSSILEDPLASLGLGKRHKVLKRV